MVWDCIIDSAKIFALSFVTFVFVFSYLVIMTETFILLWKYHTTKDTYWLEERKPYTPLIELAKFLLKE